MGGRTQSPARRLIDTYSTSIVDLDSTVDGYSRPGNSLPEWARGNDVGKSGSKSPAANS